jgi:hypothetical protein
MITIDPVAKAGGDVIINNYTALISGNGGEEQLIISTSPAHGQVRIIITRMTVMGGGDVLMNGIVGANYLKIIEKCIVNWCASGQMIESLEELLKISLIMQTLRKEWGES